LAEADLLQLATRVHLDGSHPWYSGLLLEPEAGLEHDPYWRAAEIAASKLRARVVILPACEAGASGAISGAGLRALSAALIAAGVDVVAAARWPVEAATATRWTQAFDARLAAGGTVTEAFAAAQQALRADPLTNTPRHWAAFALIGHGDVRVAL